MYTYRFPKEHMIGIMMHIEAFDRVILSMTPDADYYIIQLDGDIIPEQLQHLTDEYQFVEVIV